MTDAASVSFADWLRTRVAGRPLPTADILAAFLPLGRQVVQCHEAGQVAPLEAAQGVRCDGARLYFEEARRASPRDARAEVLRLQATFSLALDVVGEATSEVNLATGDAQSRDARIGQVGVVPERPAYFPGYVAWEHLLGHHDPPADVFVLGLVLASLACGLDLSDPEQHEQFVRHRDNPFALNSELHPVLARAILQATELDRHRRPQDLPGFLDRLEDYREQDAGFDLDLVRLPGFQQRDVNTRQAAVLSRLRDRLFEISRRNRLLYFRPTLQQLNLTEASVPLAIDLRNILPEHLMTWQKDVAGLVAGGDPLPLGRWLRFEDHPWLPGALDKIMAEARRDQAEYGFAQLRLVIAFLRWHNLKEAPQERIDSPLLLLPVKLSRKKGVRDSYLVQPDSTEVEVNPVLRHHLHTLYGLKLPESIDLTAATVQDFHRLLTAQIQAGEPGVTLHLVDRPPVKLVVERARRRLERFRRNERLAGRGIRSHGDLSYCYDRDNFHPLGLRLFQTRVRPAPAPPWHEGTTGDAPPPQHFADEADAGIERKMAVFVGDRGTNPYAWDFDLCNLTIGNFKYRKMSLVRDYESLLDHQPEPAAFQSIFSQAPRPSDPDARPALPIEERWPVVACDPTQSGAIAAARTGRSYVIQGPPGTGKSQTITNLIADFAARGKRVLFVAEKRAAIDVVFHRLKQHGLHELCCLIHDAQGDKKEFILDLKDTYESFLAPTNGPDPEQERAEVVRSLRKELRPIEAFDDAMRAVPRAAGMPLRQMLQRAVELQSHLPALSETDQEHLPPYGLWAQHAETLRRLYAALAEGGEAGPFARHPLAQLRPALAREPRPVEAVTMRLEAALAALERLEQLLVATGLPASEREQPEQVQRLAKYAAHVHFLAERRLLSVLQRGGPAHRELTVALEQQQQRNAALARAREATTGWRNKLPAGELEIALTQARQVEGAFLGFLKSAWWSLRSALHQRYDFSRHAVQPTWVQILETLQAEYQALAAVEAGDREARARYGLAESLEAFAARIQELRAAESLLKEPLLGLHRRLVASPDGDATVLALQALAPALEELERAAAAVLAGSQNRSFSQLGTDFRALQASLDRLPDFLLCLNELAQLPEPLANALRRFPLDARALEAATADRSLKLAYREDRSLEGFTAAARERAIEKLQLHHGSWHGANARAVRRRIQRAFVEQCRVSSLPAAQLTEEQKAFKKTYASGRKELEHEFGKTMRYRAVRDLFAGAPGCVMQDLKPVWLMSPLSVSDTLPLASARFDVVIFDEASQVPLEDAVPALFRGPQVIVVGDQMQLPPTSFFQSRRDEEDEDGAADAASRTPLDLESTSFLNHAARSLPSELLGWHYRSRSESLIGFSNSAFYQGRLLTVPESVLPPTGLTPIVVASAVEPKAPAAALLLRPLSFHYLEQAVYRNRRNTQEATYIAQVVRGLLADPARPSIGIVAFSEAQQEEIERALRDAADLDEAFADQLEAEWEREENGQFCGLLVKNLENIQGDERDVVVLSICYGRGPDGRVLMNFGPINQSGGEKRLNVAFSRARRHMAVVTSLRHGDVTNEWNDGAACLKQYLRYAENASIGDLHSARRVLEELHGRRDEGGDRAADDAVISQLATALAERGWVIERRVGLSHFRCDLAIRRPTERAFRAAVLVDTDEHYRAGDVLARDLLKPDLLRAFGWNVLTVLAKDWYQDRAGVLKRIEKAAK